MFAVTRFDPSKDVLIKKQRIKAFLIIFDLDPGPFHDASIPVAAAWPPFHASHITSACAFSAPTRPLS